MYKKNLLYFLKKDYCNPFFKSIKKFSLFQKFLKMGTVMSPKKLTKKVKKTTKINCLYLLDPPPVHLIIVGVCSSLPLIPLLLQVAPVAAPRPDAAPLHQLGHDVRALRPVPRHGAADRTKLGLRVPSK